MFATEDGYLFALTYGPDTDWVKNVLAAGGCELRTRGRAVRLTSPRLYHDESRAASARWNGRYCGLSASLLSCPSRPHPHRAETGPLCYPPSSALVSAHDPYPP